MSATPRWEARFRARRIGLPDFARDAEDRTIAVATTAAGTLELHWWTVGDDEPTPATDRPEGTAHGTLDPTGRFLWWFDDRKGDERGVWRRQPYGSGPGTQADATGLPAAYSRGLALGRGVAVVGSTDDDYGVRVHVVADDGSTRLLYEHEEEAYVGDLSRDETLVALAHSEHGDSRHPALRVVRVADGAPVGELWDGPGKGLEPLAFSPVAGDPRLLVTHEREGVPALVIWDPTTGAEQLVTIDLPGEVEDADWWPDAAQRRRRAVPRGAHHARAGEPGDPCRATVRADVRHGAVVAVRADGEVWATWSSAAQPSSVRRLDVGRQDEGEVVLRATRAGGAAVRAGRGRLGRRSGRPGPRAAAPTGRRPGPCGQRPLPLVVEVHGGPTHHDVDAFGAYPSAWVDHGFAVVQVNYRGSTGYGSAWRDALEARVGHVELEDVLAVRDHLVASRRRGPGARRAGRRVLGRLS